VQQLLARFLSSNLANLGQANYNFNNIGKWGRVLSVASALSQMLSSARMLLRHQSGYRELNRILHGPGCSKKRNEFTSDIN